MTKTSALLFFASFLFVLTSFAQPTAGALNQKADSLFAAYNSQNTPGCAVAVVREGKVLFEKCYGMANLEHDISITPATVFDMASISKQFTGLAISMLEQEGKINVNDDIRKYLPEMPDFGKKITISHLLHHTSGIRDWSEALILAGWREDDLFSFDDIMRMVKHQKELDFEPGSRYSYSNTGYNLLAAVVEKVSGKPFTEWVAEHIFKPLKMNTARFCDDQNIIVKNIAASYRQTKNGYVKTNDPLTAYGSSSLLGSLKDLISWTTCFDERITKKDPVYMRMLEDMKLTGGDSAHYGYGLGLDNEEGLMKISHSGSWAGFRAMHVYYPQQHLSIILLANNQNLPHRVCTRQLADFLLQRPKPASQAIIKNAPAVTIDQTLAQKYTGTYQLDSNWFITVNIKDNQLVCRTNGEYTCPMSARSDSVFWVDAYNNVISFVKDEGQYSLLFKTIVAKRFNYTEPSIDQLKQYEGDYYSEELATSYHVYVKKGKLWMYHIRTGDLAFFPDPPGDTFSCILGKFRFVKNGNSISHLEVSGSRIRNIRFSKK